MKIYNVKTLKTKLARGPPKHCQNQKPFWVFKLTSRLTRGGFCQICYLNTLLYDYMFINTKYFLKLLSLLELNIFVDKV